MAIIKKVFLPKLYLINTIHGYRETVSTHYDPSILVKKGGVFNLLNKNILKQFNKTISISNTISQLYLDLGLTKNRFPVIHHGLDIDIEKLSKDDCTIENGTPFITVVGRLAEIKGQFYLIQAMPRILEHFPTCKLYILGQGPSESILKNAVNKLSLNNFVKFEGFQQNPYKYIKNAEVLVIPSIYEPFGLVYLEGMALKTPIVTFNIPIARELLQNEHTALFANKADPNDLAEKIIDLLNYPEKRKAMSNYAFEEYERKYRLENMVTKTFLFYQSIDK